MALMRNIVVVPYDPNWPVLFAKESKRITEVFASILVGIHHVGSTSVSGLDAKPIIDILLVVRDIREVDRKNEKMLLLGYEAKGEFGIEGRRFFSKGKDDARSHHVHAFEPGNPAAANYLLFRDYLIEHQEEAAGYAKLKRKLALEFRNDIKGYGAGKDQLIKEMLERAALWRQETRSG
jgi:GrpB-like predicted nucleotidyltransferase (UPF0157 family)